MFVTGVDQDGVPPVTENVTFLLWAKLVKTMTMLQLILSLAESILLGCHAI